MPNAPTAERGWPRGGALGRALTTPGTHTRKGPVPYHYGTGPSVPRRVSDGTRTRGHLDHNQVLYQLSYTHHDRFGRRFPALSVRPY